MRSWMYCNNLNASMIVLLRQKPGLRYIKLNLVSSWTTVAFLCSKRDFLQSESLSSNILIWEKSLVLIIIQVISWSQFTRESVLGLWRNACLYPQKRGRNEEGPRGVWPLRERTHEVRSKSTTNALHSLLTSIVNRLTQTKRLATIGKFLAFQIVLKWVLEEKYVLYSNFATVPLSKNNQNFF